MFRVLLLSIFVFLFTACGGGSHEPREEKTLSFQDSLPVNGIDYSCGERKGVTKNQGNITCVYSPLTLSLGSLILGTIKNFKNNQKIYSQDLVSSFNGDFNNQELLKISILLQSLNNKQDKNYINIPIDIKKLIDFENLKDLTIDELNQKIINMGITPINKEEAKLNLVLNSPSINHGKPKIKLFEEDISNNLCVGTTIGNISIDKGDGTLILPFLLNGEGKDKFLLNNNGSLKLIQTISEPKTYNLTVTATNEFGSTTQNITIHIKDSGKIGKAQMGRLSNSEVNIFKLNSDGTKELISSTKTKSIGNINQIGNFDLKEELLEDQSFYIYEISGGEDIDIDDNGERDINSTENIGKLRLITKGIWIKNAMYKIRVTPISEILYQYVKDYKPNQLEDKLNEYAKILLDKSLDEDSDIDGEDIIFFDPTKDKEALYPTLEYNNSYQHIVNKIRNGDESYIENIFNAYIINSYPANAIEIVGSSVYTIDMLNSGEFCIYDLDTQMKIGSLKLPYTPYNQDTHVIYVNLMDSDIMISSLNEWTYFIDIHKQNKPILLKSVYAQDKILSGNFSRLAIGKSSEENIFSKNRALYFYNISSRENSTKKIKFFNIDKENAMYQYEFDSQLFNINSLWSYKNYIYILGDNKIHIFVEKDKTITLQNIYNQKEIKGNIIGIENSILYILDNKKLILMDITSNSDIKIIEEINVPFSYKLGTKTNGKYITTGSKIIDIKSLISSNHQRHN